MTTIQQVIENGQAIAAEGHDGGGTWSGLCLAFVTGAANFRSSEYASWARDASEQPLNPDYTTAPPGAWHWWTCCLEDGVYAGHVAIDLNGGGTRVMMSTGMTLDEDWGNEAGTVAIANYLANFPANSYDGWSRDCQGQVLDDLGTSPGPGPDPEPGISAEDAMILQRLAALGGYAGPIDGEMGENSWIGVQTALRDQGFGYAGPIDGVPGTETYYALQRLAQAGGYSGPVDGLPGPETYAGVAQWLADYEAGPPAPTSPLGVYGLDVWTPHVDLNYLSIRDSGYQFVIVKMGGSNVEPIYVGTNYRSEIDKVRSTGMIVGHYWVAGSNTPTQDVEFFLNNLYDYRPGDLICLDNEAIDNGRLWTDAECAAFINTVKSRIGATPFLYTGSNLLANNGPWTQTQATGAKLWIADYRYGIGEPDFGTAYPDWAIHQYASEIPLQGRQTDRNFAKLSAFEGLQQPALGETYAPVDGSAPPAPEPPTPPAITPEQGMILQRLAALGGYTGPIDGDPGSNTWLGVQQTLHNLGYYDGPIDGDPGYNTYSGLQLLAKGYGYDGPIDGDPGPRTYAGIAAFLDATDGGTSPINGADADTLQRIARAGGYTGPIDGTLGINSWSGVQRVLAGFGYTGPVDGDPGENTYAALQRFAQLGGYTGPVDGDLGPSGWQGIQTILGGFGYTGPIDGNPGTNTYAALQRLARLGGYVGPIDGVLGINSWAGVQAFLSGSGYTGPIDGDPGTNTYRAVQILAQRGGYTGPIDGIPGPMTFRGLYWLIYR